METTEWKMQIRCHVVSLWRLRQTIHEITRNGTKFIRGGSCDFLDRPLRFKIWHHPL